METVTKHLENNLYTKKEKRVSDWFKSDRFKKAYEKYMMIVGSLGQLLFYLQAIKIYQTKSAADISLSGFIIAFFSLSSWLIYGLVLKNRVLILVNVGGCFGAFLVIILKLFADLGYL